MAEITVECQGLSCPQPVLRCKQVIEAHRPERIVVLVDNQASLENVKRFLGTQGYGLEGVEEADGQWSITAALSGAGERGPDIGKGSGRAVPRGGKGKALVFLSSDRIGQGDDELGGKLMKNFLATLPEMDDLWRVICVNSAVRLAVEGSPLLDSLRALEGSGVSILVCGTCLEHLGLLERKGVGQTTNMLDVVTSLQHADKVISL
jgi:selenium metabolism protein YedF